MHAHDRLAHRFAPTRLAWLPVGVAHLALLAWMTARGPAPEARPAPRQAPLTVWLLAPPPAADVAPPATAQRPGRSAATAPAPTQAPMQTSPPAARAAATVPAEPAPAEAITPPAPEALPPLDLQLPRGTGTAARWLHDTAPPRRLEDRVAQALGGDAAWAEERIDDDTVRLRSGHRCVLLRRPRDSAVDPMGTAGRALPWQASTERPC